MNETSKELIQIRQLPITKSDIADFSNKILDALDSGTQNPLDILLRFKSFEKIFEQIKPKLMELSIIEADKYKEKDIDHLGSVFSKKESGTSYDFSNCGDSKYNDLVEVLDQAKAAVKKREDFLKGISGHETVVNESTAEIETVYPPVKRSTTILQVSIK